MDRATFVLLKSDLQDQMALIEAVYETLEKRAARLQPDDEASLESLAYQLHNLYNAVEDLLKLVAACFENQITDVARWHVALLRRMQHEIPGVRPALLSEDSYRLLNTLRGFRHFFRHAYAVPLDYDQLRVNLERARQLRPVLRQDVQRFLRQLEKAIREE